MKRFKQVVRYCAPVGFVVGSSAIASADMMTSIAAAADITPLTGTLTNTYIGYLALVLGGVAFVLIKRAVKGRGV